MRMPVSSSKHTLPSSDTLQRCWLGSVGTVVDGPTVVVVVGGATVVFVVEVLTATTIVDALCSVLEWLNECWEPLSLPNDAITVNNICIQTWHYCKPFYMATRLWAKAACNKQRTPSVAFQRSKSRSPGPCAPSLNSARDSGQGVFHQNHDISSYKGVTASYAIGHNLLIWRDISVLMKNLSPVMKLCVLSQDEPNEGSCDPGDLDLGHSHIIYSSIL